MTKTFSCLWRANSLAHQRQENVEVDFVGEAIPQETLWYLSIAQVNLALRSTIALFACVIITEVRETGRSKVLF